MKSPIRSIGAKWHVVRLAVDPEEFSWPFAHKRGQEVICDSRLMPAES